MTDPTDYACRWDAPSCRARVSEEVKRLRLELSATHDMAATLEADVLRLRAERDALRAQRERDGWKQINLWVKPEWVAKVRKYVAKLANGET